MRTRACFVGSLAVILFFLAGFSMTALAEDTTPSLMIGTRFYNATDDGRICMEIRLWFKSGSGSYQISEARNVQLSIEGDNGMDPSIKTVSWDVLTNTKTLQLECVYQEPKDRVLGEPAADPHIVVHADSSNCGGLIYTATLDMNSIPRALIVYEGIVETSDERIVPKNYGAFMNSTDVILSHYNNSHFYNGNRFVSMRIGLPIKEVPTVSIMLSMLNSDEEPIVNNFHPNDNDLTYIYIIAHGNWDKDKQQPNGLLELYSPETSTAENGIGVEFERVLQYLQNHVRGRMVLIFDNCFSGQAIEIAERILDRERFLVITACTAEFASSNDTRFDQYFFSEGLSFLTYFFEETDKDFHKASAILGSDIERMVHEKKESIWESWTQSIISKLFSVPQIHNTPQIWSNGNLKLPVFIHDSNYDDGYRLPVLKEEELVIIGSLFSGVVQDSTTHDPLAGVTVICDIGDQMRTTETDEAGRFSFVQLPVGTHNFLFQMNGYEPQNESYSVRAQPVTELPEPVGMKRVFSGRVLKEGGEPLAGQTVFISLVGETTPIYTAETDENGEYSFIADNGFYTYTVVYEGEEFSVRALLSFDSERTLPDIIIYDAVLSCSVQNADGDPLSDVAVSCVRQEDGQTLYTTANGGFTFEHLRAGTYDITCEKDGFEVKKLSCRVEANSITVLMSPIKMIPLVLTLGGRITSQTGNPIRDAIVIITHENGTQESTVSDENGRWKCNVQNGEAVHCAFMADGYKDGNAIYDSYYTKDRSYLGADIELELAKKLDLITFGHYEQDNNLSNGPEPIEWIVVGISEKKALLLSRYILDYVPFDDGESHYSYYNSWDSSREHYYNSREWTGCYLRYWLNHDFYDDSFSYKEKYNILNTKVTVGPISDDTVWTTVEDLVFLMSADFGELNEAWAGSPHFNPNWDFAAATATPYALAQENRASDGVWYLRDNEGRDCVGSDGQIMRYTYHDGPAIPEGLVGGVRPAICVSLSALQGNK